MEDLKIQNLIDYLSQQGVKRVMACPGGRCAKIFNAFLEDSRFEVESFYDERTASFYALGASMEREPVVVLTTSGSAVTELHSAVVEAFHQEHSRLILLTADRPKRYRKTGAPQTIDQENIFKNSVRSFFDLSGDDFTQPTSLTYPCHINVCLEDPNFKKIEKSEENFGTLVVISSLSLMERKEVVNALKDYEGVLFLESLSNLKRRDFPKAVIIKNLEVALRYFGLFVFSKMYRVGGVPVFKQWRQSEQIPSYYWSRYKFSGGFGVKPKTLDEITKETKGHHKNNKKLYEFDLKISEQIKKLDSKFVNSEVSVLRRLALEIPEGSKILLGNSMPIREWELCDKKNFIHVGQRGVNGIDGSLAFFLGQLDKERENWIILGDLTTLYNLNDFQIIKNLTNKVKVRIVVINNHGGQIFNRIFKRNIEHFINQQNLDFKKVADLWGIKYLKNEVQNIETNKALIELTPDNKDSDTFWKELHEF